MLRNDVRIIDFGEKSSFEWSLRTVDVLFFELEISNVLIKSAMWHICHEDIFSVTQRTVWPHRYLIQD